MHPGSWTDSASCACRGCIVPPDEDADPFVFERRVPTAQAVRINVVAGTTVAIGAAASAADDSAQVEAAEDVDEDSLRNIVAIGMKRFELAGKQVPAQPEVERLSERVINILGLNHGDAPDRTGPTLNGTNVYLVGTGDKRVLVDTAGPSPGPDGNFEIFIENLGRVLEEEGCGLDRILITHGAHFGELLLQL